MGKLDGRVAIVTGAGRRRGIGRATAMRLAEEGAAVVVAEKCDDSGSFPPDERKSGWLGARSVAGDILAQGGRAVAVTCDVTDPEQVAEMFAKANAAFGVPDAIVNNAGYSRNAGAEPIADVADPAWHRTIDVNLNGTYHVAKVAARGMLEAGRPGAIVNVSSIAGRVGMANFGAYSAAKFAVIGFMQQLALELAAHSVRVNCICPGSVETDMMEVNFQQRVNAGRLTVAQMKESVARAIPMRRHSLPEEQAAAIAFLLGPDASYITGQALNVDGGLRLN